MFYFAIACKIILLLNTKNQKFKSIFGFFVDFVLHKIHFCYNQNMESRSTKFVRGLLCSVLALLSSFFLFIAGLNIYFYFTYTITPVKGYSMLPTINSNVASGSEAGDKIYINTRSKSFETNDIVVAHVDWYEHEIIKRIVATPGDRLQILDKTDHFEVLVNDELLYCKDRYGENIDEYKSGSIGYYEKYLDFINNPANSNNVKTINNKRYIVMNENEYFLMGDNWGHTTDSIEKGPAKKEELVGKVEYILDVENDNLFVETWFMLSKVFNFKLK